MARKQNIPPLDLTLVQMITAVHAHRLAQWILYLERKHASHEQKQQARKVFEKYICDEWAILGPVLKHPDYPKINNELRTYI